MALDHFTIMEDWEDFGIISKVGFPQGIKVPTGLNK